MKLSLSLCVLKQAYAHLNITSHCYSFHFLLLCVPLLAMVWHLLASFISQMYTHEHASFQLFHFLSVSNIKILCTSENYWRNVCCVLCVINAHCMNSGRLGASIKKPPSNNQTTQLKSDRERKKLHTFKPMALHAVFVLAEPTDQRIATIGVTLPTIGGIHISPI